MARRAARASKKSHAATVLVVLALGGALAAANFIPTKRSTVNDVTTVEYGRPKTAMRYTWNKATPQEVTREKIDSSFNLDLGLAIGVMVVAAAFCEWRLYASACGYRTRRRDEVEDEGEQG